MKKSTHLLFKQALSQLIKSGKTFLLDGSMGDYMFMECNLPRHETLWMLPMIMQQKYHKDVVKIHQQYISSGSDVLIMFNYPCSPKLLNLAKCEERLFELNQTAAKIARRAINEYYEENKSFTKQLWLAGALPTPGESYHECKDMSDEEFDKVFETIINAVNPYSDFFISQTLSGTRDAYLIAKAARKYAPEKLLFISFTVDGEGLIRNGDSLKKALQFLQDKHDNKVEQSKQGCVNIAGYGINCCIPQILQKCLKEMREVTSKPLICYPNDLQEFPKDWIVSQSQGEFTPAKNMNEMDFCGYMKKSMQVGGIAMVGGCCAVNPKKISKLREIVPNYQDN